MIDSKRNTLWFLSILALALGCDATRNTDPSAGAPGLAGPRATIQDGNNNAGNEHFYWLRPMVTPPAIFTGTFDPTQAPEIRICALFADLSGCDGADIASFGTNRGAGSEIVRVEPGEEQYIVNWHTNQYNLDPAKHYRIRAYIGGTLLGVADVDVVESGKELRNVNTGEYIALLDNGTLPIKFRIEDGAVLDREPSLISAGGFHSCALATDGQAYCWGYNYYGELGNGTSEYGTNGTDYSATPLKVLVPAGVTFSEIVTGLYTTCALATTGLAFCWGYGGTGHLGNGTFTFIQPTPVAVAAGHVFTTLATGRYHSCGLKADQSAWCWGYDQFGQLGNDNALNAQNIPQPVAGGFAFRSLTSGDEHTCGVRTDGAAYCWGTGRYGQLGISNVVVYSQPTPAPVLGGHTFASIDGGAEHTCALTDDGGAWCWGTNFGGTGGTGSYSPGVNFAPTAVSGGLSFTELTAGGYHNCALVAGGSVYCWGQNHYGQVGNGFAQGFEDFPNIPTAVVGGFSFVTLDAGFYHTCGVTNTGEGRCWGRNDYGQVGDGSASSPKLTPTAVTGFRTP